MPSGGARKGAGRKSLLDFEERLWVWNEYKNLVLEATNKKTLARANEFYNKSEIDLLLDEVHNVPVNWKRKSDGKSARTIMLELSKSDDPIPEASEEYPTYIVEAAHAFRARQNILNQGRRYFHAIRINGEAPEIREQIAKAASQKFKKKVLPIYVKRIVDDRNREMRGLFDI